MTLDKSLIENNRFIPSLKSEYLLQTISDTISILKGQAELKNIDLEFEPLCEETCLVLDSMRIR